MRERKKALHVGDVFGDRVVVRFDAEKSAPPLYYWWCRCKCGSMRSIVENALRAGRDQRCGKCRATIRYKDALRECKNRTPEWDAWFAMNQRCYRVTHDCYRLYGGRGIRVCRRWRHSFVNFLRDMGRRPSSKHSIDRINNDGSYRPDNCRWATQQEQMQNVRTNVWITIGGQRRRLGEWARESGLRSGTIYTRLVRGWKTVRLLQPVRRGR